MFTYTYWLRRRLLLLQQLLIVFVRFNCSARVRTPRPSTFEYFRSDHCAKWSWTLFYFFRIVVVAVDAQMFQKYMYGLGYLGKGRHWRCTCSTFHRLTMANKISAHVISLCLQIERYVMTMRWPITITCILNEKILASDIVRWLILNDLGVCCNDFDTCEYANAIVCFFALIETNR